MTAPWPFHRRPLGPDVVMGQLADGIHPAAPANDRIAAKVIAYMEENGIRR